MKKILTSLLICASMATGLAACSSDADKASKNLSTEAEKFQIVRRIVVVNDITDKVLFEVTGRCSLESSALGNGIEITCKDAPGQYKKHFIGLGDNTSYASTQLKSVHVSTYRTTFVIKPENIVPNFDLVTGSH